MTLKQLKATIGLFYTKIGCGKVEVIKLLGVVEREGYAEVRYEIRSGERRGTVASAKFEHECANPIVYATESRAIHEIRR